MVRKYISKEDFANFLRTLEIKEEGIQAIMETYSLGRQRWQMHRLIKLGIERYKETPKQAVWTYWNWMYMAEKVHKNPVGPEPTEKDFLKL